MIDAKKELQYRLCLLYTSDVRDQRSGEISVPPRVKQRHIQHNDCRTLFLCDDAPLLQNFLIVSSETVDALDHKRIAVFQFAQQSLVAATVKVLAGLLVHKTRPVR